MKWSLTRKVESPYFGPKSRISTWLQLNFSFFKFLLFRQKYGLSTLWARLHSTKFKNIAWNSARGICFLGTSVNSQMFDIKDCTGQVRSQASNFSFISSENNSHRFLNKTNSANKINLIFQKLKIIFREKSLNDKHLQA